MLGKTLREGRHHRWPMLVARVSLILALVLMAAPATLASTEPAPPQPVSPGTDQAAPRLRTLTSRTRLTSRNTQKRSEPPRSSRPVCRRNRSP